MTVRRTYECNLCGGSDENLLVGICWKNAKKPFSKFVRQGTRDGEHHLCHICIRSARNIDIPKERP